MEVTLCHQLLNLQRTLQTKQPDSQHQQQQQQTQHFQAATYHYGEEHGNNNRSYNDEDFLFEHVQSKKSRDWTEKKNGSIRHYHHRDHDIESSAAKSYVAIGSEESKRRNSGGVSDKTAIPVKHSPNFSTNSLVVRKRSSSSTASAKPNPRKKQIKPSLNSPPCTVATSDPNALSGIRHPGKHDCLIGRGGALIRWHSHSLFASCPRQLYCILFVISMD